MKYLIGCFLLLVISSCKNEHNPNTGDATSFKAEIKKLMHTQEEAWNRGDLDAFMQPYLQSDSLLFIGSRGLTYGYSTVLENYKKSYSNATQMGTLYFEINQIKPLGEQYGLTAGRWNLWRTTDTLRGSYMLVWKKVNGEWKIIADHSS